MVNIHLFLLVLKNLINNTENAEVTEADTWDPIEFYTLYP